MRSGDETYDSIALRGVEQANVLRFVEIGRTLGKAGNGSKGGSPYMSYFLGHKNIPQTLAGEGKATKVMGVEVETHLAGGIVQSRW